MKKISLMIVAIMVLSSCGNNDETYKPDFSSWKGSMVIERRSGDKIIPLSYVFDCRKIQDFSENVHYYYSVIVNPETIKVHTAESNVKETTYSQAEFQIEYYSSNTDGTSTMNRNIVAVDVDFKIVEYNEGKGDKIAILSANKLTIARVEKFYSNNPFFNSLKEGDEIMAIIELADSKVKSTKLNGTKKDLPGLRYGEKIECR